jgi:uncharacterized protein DUF3572
MAYSTEQAEMLAIQALGWIADQQDLLMAFLSASGSDLADLQTRAGEAEFLGAVLDFLLMDDVRVTGFCNSAGVGFDAPIEARQMLPGGDVPNWT